MHSGGRKLHQLMVIADCPLRSLANGGLYVRDVGENSLSACHALSRLAGFAFIFAIHTDEQLYA